MDPGSNRSLAFGALGGGALCILLSYYAGQPLLLALSALCFLVSIALWRFGYVLLPLLTGATRTALAGDGHEIPPSHDVVVKRTSQGYYATRYLGLELRESARNAGEAGRGALMETFERAISSTRFTLKISLLVCPLALDDYTQKLEEKRSLLEHRRSQLAGARQDDERARLEREIAALSGQLQAIGGGQRPMQVLAYAATTAFGLTREEALSRSKAQAQEAATLLSTSLDCSVHPLAGPDLMRAFDWEKAHPPSRAELEDALF